MIGPYLRHLREAAGLSVPNVVETLGVPRATAYSWERDDARPEPDALQRLLDLYGASDEQRLEAWRLRALPREASPTNTPPTEAA